MSYILEALKKAEQQRELGQVPGISSEHDAGAGSGSRRWVWIVMLVVNAVILLLLALLWMRTDSTAVRAPDPVSIAEPGDPVTVPAAPRARTIRIAPLPVVSDPVITSARPGNRAPVATAPDVQMPVSEPVEPIIVEPVESVSDAEIPIWPQVPEYLLTRLTSGLRLDVHVYSEHPEDRFVLINLAKYREGDTLQDGSIVQEITPRGAIMSLQGERFRLLAQ